MMKYFLSVILLLTGIISCKKNEIKPPRPEFARVAWILGSWEGRDSNSVYFEEWGKISDELFEGKAIVKVKDDTVFSERMTIEVLNSTVVYRAIIGKNEPVLFKLVSADEQMVSFSNPQHDFPQNIAYSIRPDGSLYAYVDGMAGKQYRKEEYFYNQRK